MIYVNKIENRITFKIKTGSYIELLTPETLKWWECASLKITEVILVHCNIVNNDYQQDSRVFVPNKSYSQLLNISPKNFIFLKDLNSEFSYNEVWFNNLNSKPLEI